MKMLGKNLRRMTIVLSNYLLFLIIWGVRENYINLSFGNIYYEAIINFIIYGGIWLGFSFLFIKQNEMYLEYGCKEMFTSKPNIKVIVIGGGIILAYQFLCWAGESFEFHFQMNWLDYILTCASVGIFEESVFRGCFYNMLSTFMDWKWANVLSSFLFVAVHYPRWIFLGRSLGLIIYGSIFVFILGLCFGYVFKKTRSIWEPAILHSLWDALAFLI